MEVEGLTDCPLCGAHLSKPSFHVPLPKNLIRFECANCTTFDTTPEILAWAKGASPVDRAKASYQVRRLNRSGQVVDIVGTWLHEFLPHAELPSPVEQIDAMLLYIGGNTHAGEALRVHWIFSRAAVGAITDGNIVWINDQLQRSDLAHLRREKFIDWVTLTSEGWQRYGDLVRGRSESRKAFMAMQYGAPVLDEMFRTHFRPAVAETGFHLERLDEEPKAGLIDDRLRVEIRTSRLLIADLTHDNRGAYWEAGFAEGLGKPVIYTCEESVFAEKKTHFDTEHHLTVRWNEKEPERAVAELKATIRATLPGEAKLTDG